MVNDYFLAKRKKIFPEIKDFSNPQDHIRNEKNVNKLKWHEWFWLHPSAFGLMSMGIPICALLVFLLGTMLCISKGWTFASIVFGLLSLLFYWESHKKVKIYKSNPTATFYDMFMRDY